MKITPYNHHLRRLLLSERLWSFNRKTNSGTSSSLRSYPINLTRFFVGWELQKLSRVGRALLPAAVETDCTTTKTAAPPYAVFVGWEPRNIPVWGGPLPPTGRHGFHPCHLQPLLTIATKERPPAQTRKAAAPSFAFFAKSLPCAETKGAGTTNSCTTRFAAHEREGMASAVPLDLPLR
jgi:hypothetical protein